MVQLAWQTFLQKVDRALHSPFGTQMAVLCFLILFLMVSNIIAQQSAQYIGHRGCRGVYPENTIEGLKKAIQYGADGIEWDVVINKDDEIIISHEPYIDTTYCQLKDGVDDPKKK